MKTVKDASSRNKKSLGICILRGSNLEPRTVLKHPLVTKTLKSVGSYKNKYGLIEPTDRCLDIEASLKSYNRGLLILQAISDELSTRGFTLEVGKRVHKYIPDFPMRAVIDGEAIGFKLTERVLIVNHTKKNQLALAPIYKP